MFAIFLQFCLIFFIVENFWSDQHVDIFPYLSIYLYVVVADVELFWIYILHLSLKDSQFLFRGSIRCYVV